MHPYCIYVFDSVTANEAAAAVKDGHYTSIIQYHSNKHQHMNNNSKQHSQMHLDHQPPMMGAPPPPQSHPPYMAGCPPQAPPPTMQPQQCYDPVLSSPQKMKERERKLNKLEQLAQLTSHPPPPNMGPVPTQMSMNNMNPAQQPPPPRPMPQHPQMSAPTQAKSQQPPTQQTQQQQPQQQQQHSQHQQQQQQLSHIKQEQEHLDPLSSMEAMSECPNLETYGHTVHHMPPN